VRSDHITDMIRTVDFVLCLNVHNYYDDHHNKIAIRDETRVQAVNLENFTLCNANNNPLNA
jgi:hypothetical protein